MEGYLTLITNGFPTAKLRKVWVVLDRQQLTWYDRLDPADQMPKKLKGVLFIRGAQISKTPHRLAADSLLIVCDATKTLFGCEDATDCSNWYKALVKSLLYHTEAAARDRLPKEYREVMEFGAEETLSKALLSRTYKRLCLKEHPDKGGNIERFNKIKEAYNYLAARQEYEDEMERTMPLQYEVTIRKKDGKVGLGMTVSEDKVHQRLLIGKINPEIDIVDISEESGGKIKPGDRLMGIDHDDCSLWITNRLLARLNHVRIPVGGSVVFTLERRVSPDEMYGSDSENESESEQEVFVQSATPSPVPPTIFQNTTGTNHKTNDEHSPLPDGAHSQGLNANKPFAEAPDAEESGSLSPISPHPTTQSGSVRTVTPTLPVNHSPGNSFYNAAKENAEDKYPPANEEVSSTPLSPGAARAAALERRRLKQLQQEQEETPIVVVALPPPPADTQTSMKPVIKPVINPVMSRSASPPPSPPPLTPSMLRKNQAHEQMYTSSADSGDQDVSHIDWQEENIEVEGHAEQTISSSLYQQLLQQHKQEQETLQAQLQAARGIVASQSEKIEHLSAENQSLKDTIASLARFMDQKALASPELRTQHILSLHQELLESKMQKATLEQALARVDRLNMEHWESNGVERSHYEGTDHDNVFDNLQADLRSEQTRQALRVEKMLQSAIMQAGN